MAPDRLVTTGALTFDPRTGLTLDAGASAFVVDRTYADLDISLDAPTGEPAVVVLRDDLGGELEIGGVTCPGAIVGGAPSSVTLQRRGATVTWSVSGKAAHACPTDLPARARVSVGVRGAPAASRSVARNLRITRVGPP
jgi:hypothetical protein